MESKVEKLKGEIILVDDEKYEEEFLNFGLDELEYDVEVKYFDKAADALEYLKTSTEKIFLIISDISMSPISGLDFKEALNAEPELKKKSVPFIFYSNEPTEQNIDKAYKLGIQGFFKKPMELKKMTEVLSVIIKYWVINHHPKTN